MFFRTVILSTFLILSIPSIGQIDIDLLDEYRGRYLGDFSYWLICNEDSNLVKPDTLTFTANHPICDDSFGFEFKKKKIKSVGGYNKVYRLVYPKKIAKFYKEEDDWYLRLLIKSDLTKIFKLFELSKTPNEKGGKQAYAPFRYKMIFVKVEEIKEG
jgi:hypothetical protein